MVEVCGGSNNITGLLTCRIQGLALLAPVGKYWNYTIWFLIASSPLPNTQKQPFILITFFFQTTYTSLIFYYIIVDGRCSLLLRERVYKSKNSMREV